MRGWYYINLFAEADGVALLEEVITLELPMFDIK